MNVFDIIGPVMVGPSSSHTAGAVKIGRIVRELLGEQPVDVVIELHGSFARTFKGHGTDKAIIAGLMGMLPDDGQIRDSLELAQQAGMKYRFKAVTLKDAHPNTAYITAVSQNAQSISLQGASVGGGNIIIKKVNGIIVDFTGQNNTLIISHNDTAGVIAEVTNLLSNNSINIANMKDYRSYRGGEAMMVIETDQEVGRELETSIGLLSNIKNVMSTKSI